MCNVPGRKNIYFFKVNLNMYYKMSCVHDEHRLGYGYDDAGDELLAKDVVRRQQWWLLPVPDVLRILRRLAGVYVRMDQQADILACWLVYIYMAFIRICTCIFVFTVPVDFATDSQAVLAMAFFKSTFIVHAVYVFSHLRLHADRRSFNVVLQIVSLTDLTIYLIQTLHCFWILLTSKAVQTILSRQVRQS